jgi:kynurenine formamidase
MASNAPRVVDLTLPLEHGMRGVEIETARTLAEGGWNARTLHLYSHSGTHMDAPAHFEAGGRTIDEVRLEECMGPAWVADIRGLAPRAVITVADLGGIGKRLAPGDGLLLRTGWSAHLRDAKLYRDGLPRVGEELARWCVERRVKMLGVEPPSVADVNDLRELTLVHGILLRGGVVIVEGLANLDALEEERVFFVAAPLRVRGGDGAPCRAFALVGAAWEARGGPENPR